MTDAPDPRLTDAKRWGGIVAQDGIDYQVWDAIVRIPQWIRTYAFEGVTMEGFEDVEARFFAPHAPHGHVLDRFQAKSSSALTPRQVTDVFHDFATFEESHPGVARVHVLVTPALPARLQWIARDAHRVRGARPFYAPFADVLASTDEKFKSDLTDQFGPDLGPMVARSVEVCLRHIPSREVARALFQAELEGAFPELSLGAAHGGAAFLALDGHLRTERGRLVDRRDLLRILADATGSTAFIDGPLPVHVRSDRNAPAADAVEIDASAFSLVGGPLPSPEQWQDGLMRPLARTARWAGERSVHVVRLMGSYRISTALAVGWSFRAPTGFELLIATRGGEWETDNGRVGVSSNAPWEIVEPQELHGDRLAVCIGVIRDPTPDVERQFALEKGLNILTAQSGQAIGSGEAAQVAAQAIKMAVAATSGRLAPRGIDLFFAGPAALAVAIGHCWNAMPTTQLYEYRPGVGYHPLGVLG